MISSGLAAVARVAQRLQVAFAVVARIAAGVVNVSCNHYQTGIHAVPTKRLTGQHRSPQALPRCRLKG